MVRATDAVDRDRIMDEVLIARTVFLHRRTDSRYDVTHIVVALPAARLIAATLAPYS
jgi:hypothetical protein